MSRALLDKIESGKGGRPADLTRHGLYCIPNNKPTRGSPFYKVIRPITPYFFLKSDING